MAVLCMYEEHKKPTYIDGRVGGYVVFNCKNKHFKIKDNEDMTKNTVAYFYRSA